MAALASDWLRHFQLLLWNRWTEFNETWQEARSQCPLPSLCFSGRSAKQDGRPGLWLAKTFSTSPLKWMNRIQWNLIGSKISTPSTKIVFFGPIGKTKLPPWPLIGWDIFDFSSETAEQNSAKLDRKQAPNAFYHICVFQANGEKTKWPPWPLIGQDIFDFSSETVKGIWWNLIGSKIWTPSTKFVFSGGSEKQNGRRGLWFAETFSTFPLKPLNRIQQNLTGSKISTSSTRLAFFGLIKKNKIAALSSDWLRDFWLLLWNHWTEFNEIWQKASSQRPLPSLCFSGWSKKQYGRPGLWLAETYFDFSSETAERNSAKLDRKQDLNVLCFSGRKVNKNCHPGQSIKEGGTLYSGACYGALWASCLWIYLGEVRGVHQFMYMYWNT